MTTNFFSGLVKAWDLASSEQALVERAIGSAVFDKLAGKATSLAASYKAVGGVDGTTAKILGSVDGVFGAVSYEKAASVVAEATGHASFSAASEAWDIAGAELALIERTLGQSYFKRLQGAAANLNEVYSSLGGTDSTTSKVLAAIGPLWDDIKVSNALYKVSAAVA